MDISTSTRNSTRKLLITYRVVTNKSLPFQSMHLRMAPLIPQKSFGRGFCAKNCLAIRNAIVYQSTRNWPRLHFPPSPKKYISSGDWWGGGGGGGSDGQRLNPTASKLHGIFAVFIVNQSRYGCRNAIDKLNVEHKCANKCRQNSHGYIRLTENKTNTLHTCRLDFPSNYNL